MRWQTCVWLIHSLHQVQIVLTPSQYQAQLEQDHLCYHSLIVITLLPDQYSSLQWWVPNDWNMLPQDPDWNGGGDSVCSQSCQLSCWTTEQQNLFCMRNPVFFSVRVTCSCHPTWLPLLLVEWFLLFFLFVLKSISIVPCSVPVRVKAAPTLLHQQYVPLHLSTFLIVRGVTACLLDLLISVWWLSSTDLNSWKNLCDSWRTLRERNLCRLLSKKLYHLLRYWRYVVPVHQQC